MIFKLPVKKIMVNVPLHVSCSTSVKDAVEIMKEYKINSLLVKRDNRFVGIVTDVDLIRQGVTTDIDARRMSVESIMTSPILTIDEDDSIDRASELMSEKHIRHLVVTRGTNPIGIISARDLLDPVYEEEGGVPFWPNHLLKEVIAVFIMLGLLCSLIVFIPAPMEPKADPFITPEHIKPEWVFLAAYQFLKVAEVLSFISPAAPKVLGVLMQGIFVISLFFIPFIDRNKERRPWKRPIAVSLGITGLVLFIIFTIWGHLS